jgi:hypothetical protein
MEEYKKLAQQKHALFMKQEEERLAQLQRLQDEKDEEQKHVEREAEIYLKREAEIAAEREAERIRSEEVKRAHHFQVMNQLCTEWDVICVELEQDPLLQIHLLSTFLESVLPECTEEDKQMWQEKVTALIQTINDIQQKRNTPLEEVRQLALIMEHICGLVGVDMTIEQMDTTEDETTAMRVAEQEWQEDFALQDAMQDQQWIPVERVFHNVYAETEPFGNGLPRASLRKGVGLTLTQLKEIARFRGQKITGTKEELCMRLAQAGWIQLE